MTTFTRGSSITFRASCLDAAGQPFTPTAATLTLSYAAPDGTRQRTTMDMPGGAASWNSAEASDSMPVHWHIRASSATEQVAQDGALRLVAQEANPSK